MILTTPNELSQFLPNHVLQNLDNLQGFFAISEADFLADRIGRPLLQEMQKHYDDIRPVCVDSPLSADDPERPWYDLILLCQPVVAFDAVARSADIQAVSVNQGGINISEAGGYDIAPDKYIANYKAQCVKESHAAVNRLLIQLEEWQQQVAATQSTDAQSPATSGGSSDGGAGAPSPSDSADFGATLPPALGGGSGVGASMLEIVTLWKQSAYYYFADGLLFTTAQQFGSFIDIYESREKFIQLLPDIRYCQEVHIEAEIGEELLLDLIEKHRTGQLNTYEAKAYRMLQRTLSLYVEARSPILKSKNKSARDEACGHMALTHKYITTHQQHFDADAMALSPLYTHAPVPSASPAGSVPTCCCNNQPIPASPHCASGSRMLVSSLI